VSVDNLTGGKRLAKNTLWNLGGNIAAIIISVLSLPIILTNLGTERMGVITLIWLIEGQFGIFDAGLSYAVTKLIAEKLGESKEGETPPIFWSSMLLMGLLGVVGGAILWFISPWLVGSALKVPLAIQPETLISFGFVAASLPITISTAALKGALVAHQRFDILNITRVPFSLLSYLLPLLVLPFSKSLCPFVAVLVFARVVMWIVLLAFCFKVSPVLRNEVSAKNAPLRRMFSFGGWMSVTNIVGPIMVNFDRILIGSVISVAAVAYYAAPYEMATKLWIIPTSVTGVLFPAFSTTFAYNKERTAVLYGRALKYIFISVFPMAIGAMALGGWVISVLLGDAFARESTVVLQLLVLGVFVNSLAQVPFWLLQAAGRPERVAIVHLLELPCYLFGFWYLTKHFGIVGAAMAWGIRSCLDAVIMFWLSEQVLPTVKGPIRNLAKLGLAIIPVVAICLSITSRMGAILFTVIVMSLLAYLTWRYALSQAERSALRRPLQFFAKRRMLDSEA
jgi:O-antigen/teichoic acid export membrane protein